MNEPINVLPLDEYNQKLISFVHPSDWVNPEPQPRYNLVVIGAGTAGLVTAAGAAGLGAKVALIEKHLMGGDCLNVGCVPSKCMIRSARTIGEIQKAAELGIKVTGTEVDFAAVMERMRKLRSEISHVDSASRFQDLGVDVFLGTGQFINHNTIEVAGKQLKFKKAVIATGARAAKLKIPGLEATGYLTNETVFSLTKCPPKLAIIGAGPIGCELAQTFQRLGSQVYLFHKNSQILDKEDEAAASILQHTFIQEEIQLFLNSKINQIEKQGEKKVIFYQTTGQTDSLEVDEILVAIGRQPNVEGLNLEAVGVDYDSKKGVIVDDKLQTSNPRIFAAGDICMNWKFTHAADAAARMVIQNSLFLGQKKLSSLVMPWCTYTDPEIAHVGLSEKEAKQKGIALDTFFIPLEKVDRAIADGETSGFAKIHVQKNSDKILGATIVASHAGDLIHEITLAMTANLGLGKIATVIHPYPTQGEVIKKAADAYNRTRLTPLVQKLFKLWLEWTR